MAGRGDSGALSGHRSPGLSPSSAWEARALGRPGLSTPVLQGLIGKVRALPAPPASGVSTGSACWQTLLSEMPDLMCKTNAGVA